MANVVNAKATVGIISEPHAVISDAKTQFTALTLKLSHIALSGLGEALQRRKDSHGGLTVQQANLCARLLRPDDLPHA